MVLRQLGHGGSLGDHPWGGWCDCSESCPSELEVSGYLRLGAQWAHLPRPGGATDQIPSAPAPLRATVWPLCAPAQMQPHQRRETHSFQDCLAFLVPEDVSY